jgi:hypothetical protein
MPQEAVVKGHIVSAGAMGEHWVDAKVMRYDLIPANQLNSIEGMDRSGTYYFHKVIQSDVWPIHIRRTADGTLAKALAGLNISNTEIYVDPDGGIWVAGNWPGSGTHVLVNPKGQLKYGYQGESRGAVTFWNGEILWWSVGVDGAGPFIIGRPISTDIEQTDPKAIILRRVWYGYIQINPVKDGYLITGTNNDNGDGYIALVPFDGPRGLFVPVPFPTPAPPPGPVEPPQPPTPPQPPAEPPPPVEPLPEVPAEPKPRSKWQRIWDKVKKWLEDNGILGGLGGGLAPSAA